MRRPGKLSAGRLRRQHLPYARHGRRPAARQRHGAMRSLRRRVLLTTLQLAEKEEFKAYLEKTGAVDALTRGALPCASLPLTLPSVFAGLFAEHDRPQNPTECGPDSAPVAPRVD